VLCKRSFREWKGGTITQKKDKHPEYQSFADSREKKKGRRETATYVTELPKASFAGGRIEGNGADAVTKKRNFARKCETGRQSRKRTRAIFRPRRTGMSYRGRITGVVSACRKTEEKGQQLGGDISRGLNRGQKGLSALQP